MCNKWSSCEMCKSWFPICICLLHFISLILKIIPAIFNFFHSHSRITKLKMHFILCIFINILLVTLTFIPVFFVVFHVSSFLAGCSFSTSPLALSIYSSSLENLLVVSIDISSNKLFFAKININALSTTCSIFWVPKTLTISFSVLYQISPITIIRGLSPSAVYSALQKAFLHLHIQISTKCPCLNHLVSIWSQMMQLNALHIYLTISLPDMLVGFHHEL